MTMTASPSRPALKESFEEEYKTYDCYWGQNPSDLVVEVARQTHGGVALDLGAGEGRNALFLAEHGFSVTAVDVAPKGLEKLAAAARQKGLDVKTQITNITALEFDRDYDLVVAIAILHFLPTDQSKIIIERMKAHTKASGLNTICVFTEDNPVKNFPGLFKRWELAMFYSDWEIVKYEERLTSWEQHCKDSTPHRHAVARLIAKRP
jgi:tellurite methyltransferase